MKFLPLVLLLFLFSCSQKHNSILSNYQSADLEKYFLQNDINGCFVIYDLKNDVRLSYNTTRCDSTFLPASTFKIINSMIALETEVIKNEKEIIKWDSISRFVKIWNQDHNLETGIKYSVVWMYQELARRIGEDRMKYWVEKSNYGNKNIGGDIDTFWLEGDIRITPNQQIDFLKRLYHNQLPFKKINQEKVKSILVVDQNEDYIIRAKTGWAARIEKQIGWYVGYLERDDNVYFFAINIDIAKDGDAAMRKNITSKILDHLQLTKQH